MITHIHVQIVSLPDQLTISPKGHLGSGCSGELAENWYAIKTYFKKGSSAGQLGFVWSLHLSLTSKNPCLSLAGDCARLRADLLQCDWDVHCGSSHRSRLLHGLVTEDGPGNTA